MLGITFFHPSANAEFVDGVAAGTSVEKGRSRGQQGRPKRREACRNMILIAGFSVNLENRNTVKCDRMVMVVTGGVNFILPVKMWKMTVMYYFC